MVQIIIVIALLFMFLLGFIVGKSSQTAIEARNRIREIREEIMRNNELVKYLESLRKNP